MELLGKAQGSAVASWNMLVESSMDPIHLPMNCGISLIFMWHRCMKEQQQ